MSEGTDTLIEGSGVTKVFKDFWGRPRVTAVRDVDITVSRGQIVGLLGPNGAGKSTLIKLLLGHLYPTAGRLRVLGRPPTDVDTKQRLGYLPERTAFYRTLTADEVLGLFGRLLGLSAREIGRRADQLLDMVGLQHVRRRRIEEYSHGMGRRLGLAQALLNDPDLLLLDEPTAGLDPIGCHEVKALIATLAERGKTVLLSSHLLADVGDVCDTVVIMYGGRVQQSGPVGELLSKADEIQIRAPMPPEPVLAELRRLLGAASDPERVSVSSPTRSLEDYFLEVVRSASRSQDTAGARMGTGVAEYLRDGVAAEELLARLSTEEPAPRPAAEEPAPEPVDTKALQALAETPTEPESDRDEAADEAVDQDLLDTLTER